MVSFLDMLTIEVANFVVGDVTLYLFRVRNKLLFNQLFKSELFSTNSSFAIFNISLTNLVCEIY